MKVARGGCLPYFTHIFDALARLATDQEGSVRSGAEALDRLMKDIVSESPAFDLVAFMTMLRERIMTQSTAARQFLVGWVSFKCFSVLGLNTCGKLWKKYAKI